MHGSQQFQTVGCLEPLYQTGYAVKALPPLVTTLYISEKCIRLFHRSGQQLDGGVRIAIAIAAGAASWHAGAGEDAFDERLEVILPTAVHRQEDAVVVVGGQDD